MIARHFYIRVICVNLRLNSMKQVPEEIELYRDRKWRREESLKVDTAEEAEAMVAELGFCLGLTDVRKMMPSVYIAVCGRRDAHMPRNVQKDYEASRAWVLKDEVMARGKVYYAKLVKGKSWFLASRMIPVFNAIWGCSPKGESGILSKNAQLVLKVLRKEWEMATADLREECGFKDKKDLTTAIDELQRRMKVVPQEALYKPKFTYVWTLSEARFPEQIAIRMKREDAVRELARTYLQMCGMTLVGELSGKFGLQRWESGKANHALVDEGFVERIATGVYRLADMSV
ncbi:MAG: winged helix DNA-binding domain-containing protein [Pyrinomonadaceae bacterium]|nr:winged helix DNA-binding domain-containing protein [Pyrinomonadaceae bacterium]